MLTVYSVYVSYRCIPTVSQWNEVSILFYIEFHYFSDPIDTKRSPPYLTSSGKETNFKGVYIHFHVLDE